MSGAKTRRDGKLRVYGTTGHGFYEEGSGGYNSPKGDNGTLSSISGVFKYVTPEASERHFNSNGYQTKIQSPDGFEVVTFTLNGSNDVSKMETADGAVNTFTYSGGVLAKIETGSRTVTLTHSTGDLTKVENPDNGVRSFTYNASSKLTDDAFDIVLGSYGYDSGVLNAWTSGDATASEDVETTLEPQAGSENLLLRRRTTFPQRNQMPSAMAKDPRGRGRLRPSLHPQAYIPHLQSH